MARHMAHYFDLLEVGYRVWTRRDPPGALASRAVGARAVLLLLSDTAIHPFVKEHRQALGDAPLIHFSGSARIPGTWCCHPLGSFGAALHPPEVYRAVTFACDPGPPAFPELFPDLPNPHVILDPDLRPLHHALAVLSGNFTAFLWRKARREWAPMGIGPGAVSAYLETVVANLREDPEGSVTGPLTRGDDATVASNLEALGDDPWAGVYRAVVQALRWEGEPSEEDR
jgi:hypothetical protein